MMNDSPTPLLQDYLVASARARPEHVALVVAGQRYTYGDLEARSNALAHALLARGVERGDRVVIFGDNCLETVIAFWAVLKANAVVSLVSPLTKADKLAYYLNDCRATALISDGHITRVFADAARRAPHLKTVIVSGELDAAKLAGLPVVAFGRAIADAPQDAPPRRNIDIDLAAIIYTSGSTGEPKGVMLTHRNMLTAAASISTYLEMRDDDIVLGVLPLSFDYGLYQMIMTFRVGGRLVLERSFVYPAQVLDTVIAEGVTGFPGVPTIFAVMAEMKSIGNYDFSRIRYVSSTAAALPQKHIDMIRRLIPNARMYSMYGLTECKRCTYLPPKDVDRKRGSVGIAIPNTELWIVDENGQKVGPNVVGQLVIRGATVMRGYWEKPEATAAKLKPGPLPGEMVLYTGDLCRLDEEGYLYFVSRMDEVIKSRGEKVAPREVENAIVDIAGVKETAVIGVPDEILGQAIKAFVVLEAGATLSEQDIKKECQKRLENFMVPRHVEIVPDLPKTTSNKISKTSLRAAAAPAPENAEAAIRSGRHTFLGVELQVAQGALVPRAETEILGRAAIEICKAGGARVIDMCCGSGNLACAIAHATGAHVWASDLTPECVQLSRTNVDQLGLGERVEIFQGDLFAPLGGLGLEGTIDLIVCNPPYISTSKLAGESAHLLAHEPREAFDGGPFGFSIHQRVIAEALPFLRDGGRLAFEFGVGQERQLEKLFARSQQYGPVEFHKDADGRPRVAISTKRSKA